LKTAILAEKVDWIKMASFPYVPPSETIFTPINIWGVILEMCAEMDVGLRVKCP
jgi:hypothetical protein